MKNAAAKLTSMLGVALTLSFAAEPAEARRGGSFGSRGARTYSAPPPTRTAPQQTAPVQRSMTAPPQGAAPGAPNTAARPAPGATAPAAQAPRRGGFLGGMGGGILGGLVAGGLIGMMMGHGFGGMGAGLANTLLQVALIGGAIWLVMALLRRRRPALAPAGFPREAASGPAPGFGGFGGFGGGHQTPEAPPRQTYTPSTPPAEDIGLIQADRDAFERLLYEVQDAFGREDYAALRERTTPEIMSYLSEELSQNAVQGRRNEVSGARLLQADVAEAWREGDTDYATAALRYESIDVMRDRQSGAVVSGDPDRPTETTELWTFVRRGDEAWKLSAIQEA